MVAQPISMPIVSPAEIQTLIDAVLGGFNSKNSALYSSGDVVIVGGMAPHRWIGRNAQSRWFADAEKWAHDLGVADENIAYDRIPSRADVVDTHACVVLSANLSFTSRASVQVGLVSSPSRWRSKVTSGRLSRRHGVA